MSDKVKNGVLIGVAVLLLVNIGIMLMDDDGVSYDKTTTDSENVSSSVAATDNAAQINANQDANVVNTNTGPKTSVKFEEMQHDFGEIEQNSRNTKIFTFTNSGTEPLIITNAKGSCGCTVPRYPREPVAPGESGEIEVVYSPGSQKNQQTKSVTITANTEPETTVLKITANVKAGDAANNEAAGEAVQIGG